MCAKLSCIFRYSFSAASWVTAGPFLCFLGGGGAADEVGSGLLVASKIEGMETGLGGLEAFVEAVEAAVEEEGGGFN